MYDLQEVGRVLDSQLKYLGHFMGMLVVSSKDKTTYDLECAFCGYKAAIEITPDTINVIPGNLTPCITTNPERKPT